MRLYADNLDQFINGNKTFYTVPLGKYQKNSIIDLYDDHNSYKFEITYILDWGDRSILALTKIKE